MRRAAIALGLVAVTTTAGAQTVLYNNDTPTNTMAMASRPDVGATEIEAADDFVLTAPSLLTSATFTGLLVGSGITPANIGLVRVEIYRVFPLDSQNPPSGAVPTRANSPSDVALDSRDAGAGLTFTTSVLAGSFTASNSVLNGINPSPNQRTGGDGAVSGEEVRFNVTFTSPILLGADHYFFVPQVQVTSGGQFYWLSASRPISGAGTTPFSPDLQAWIRNAGLDPNWLRVGTDIVGGASPPTFNAAFSVSGTTIPEPSSLALVATGIVGVVVRARRRRRR